jgi:hypothetical protein
MHDFWFLKEAVQNVDGTPNVPAKIAVAIFMVTVFGYFGSHYIDLPMGGRWD